MATDTYTITFGATSRKLVKPYNRKINWQTINVNQDQIAEQFTENYSAILALQNRVDAIEVPIFSASEYPFMTGTTFPITGAGAGFQIQNDFLSRMWIFNATPDLSYYISSIEELVSPGNAIKITVSNTNGVTTQEVASVTVTKANTDAGTRDFIISELNSSRVHGALVAGDDFIAALAAVATQQTSTFSLSQTRLNPSFVQMMEEEDASAVAGAHIHRERVLPLGSQDGANKTFTAPNAEEWNTDTIVVFLNNVAYNPGEITEITATTFTLASSVPSNRVPNALTGLELRVSYIVQAQSAVASSASVVKDYQEIGYLTVGSSMDVEHRADLGMHRLAQAWTLEAGGSSIGGQRLNYNASTSNEYTIEYPVGTPVSDGVIDDVGFRLYNVSNDLQNPACAVPATAAKITTLGWTNVLGVTVGSTEPANTNVRWGVRFDASGDFYYHDGAGSWQTLAPANVFTSGLTTIELATLGSTDWDDTNGFVAGTTDTIQFLACVQSTDQTANGIVSYIDISNEFNGLWKQDSIDITLIDEDTTRFTNNGASNEYVLANVHISD